MTGNMKDKLETQLTQILTRKDTRQINNDIEFVDKSSDSGGATDQEDIEK